jgi:hypothetical protein
MHPSSRKLSVALATVWLAACSAATLPSYPIEHPANPEAPMAPISEPADSLTSSRRPLPADAGAAPIMEHHHEKP